MDAFKGLKDNVDILIEKSEKMPALLERVDALKDGSDILYTELDKILTIFMGAATAIRGGGNPLSAISKAITELGGDRFDVISKKAAALAVLRKK